MASLHYLTIQDVLWINLQITKKVQHFNYARLEEAVFYQYAYGESNTLLPQAGRFVEGFMKMKPFDSGNEATAIVATIAFIEINGYRADLDDPAAWMQRIMAKQVSGHAAVEEVAKQDEHAHHGLVPDVRAAIRAILTRYPHLIDGNSTQAA